MIMNNQLNQAENQKRCLKFLLVGLFYGFVISSCVYIGLKAAYEVPDRFSTKHALTQDELKSFNFEEFVVNKFVLSALPNRDYVSSLMRDLDSDTGFNQHKFAGCDDSVSKKERKRFIYFLGNIDGKSSEFSPMTISLHDRIDANNKMGCGVQEFMINISSQ